jgi:hypothetical protein
MLPEKKVILSGY